MVNSTVKKTNIPLVSVCIVTYNQQKYIRECLYSICNQITDFEYEVIVSDDSSTDSTAAIIGEFQELYPEKLRKFIQIKNLGPTKNYIFCHKQAFGKYTAHCDGDDYWDFNKLQSQLNFMESHPSISAVLTNAYVVTTKGVITGVFSQGVPVQFDLEFLIRDGNFLTHSSLLYRSNYFSRIIPNRKIFLDYDILINLSLLGNLGFISDKLVYYRTASETSLILNDSLSIRKLVWISLANIGQVEGTEILKLAKANFLSREIINGIRFRDTKSLSYWFDTCSSTASEEGLKFIFLLLKRIAINSFKKTYNRLITNYFGVKKCIIYYKK